MSLVLGRTDRDNFTIGLDKDCVRVVVEAIEIGDNATAIAEGGIDCSI